MRVELTGQRSLPQKQLTENEVAEQKANVAALRADVTVDTTQIGHKILRQVFRAYPTSFQLHIHAGWRGGKTCNAL